MSFRNPKRRTARRNTSKTRQKLSNASLAYDRCEPRLALATFVVTTPLDLVDADDGLISLREAVTAANSNAAFSDAQAGNESGDRIVFSSLFEDSAVETVLTQGELEITDDLVIRGRVTDSSQQNTISGGDKSRIFNINTTETVRLHRVALSDGNAQPFTNAGDGGLVYVQPGSDVAIFRSVFTDGHARGGGALFVDSATVTIQGGSSFISNEVTFPGGGGGGVGFEGGAIHAVDSDITIGGGEFLGNTAILGKGGAIATVGGVLRMYSVAFGGINSGDGNSADSGGAIHTQDTRVISNSTFVGNKSASGGGAIFSSGKILHILNGSLFSENGLAELPDNREARHAGGAIESLNDALYISGAVFEENLSISGGAIWSSAKTTVINEVLVANNSAVRGGGGFYLANAEATYITGTTFDGNRASGDTTLGILGRGGALALENFGADLRTVLRRVSLNSNSALTGGGAIYSQGGSSLHVYGTDLTDNSVDEGVGGAISLLTGNLIVAGSQFQDNIAQGEEGSFVESGNGGAIYSERATTLIYNSGFTSNSASLRGGALSAAGGYMRVAGSNLSSNQSGIGGAAFVGHSASPLPTAMIFVGGQIENNIAEVTGGAITVAIQGRFVARQGATFTGNNANFGGAIHSRGIVNLSNAIFDGNAAEESGGAILLAEESQSFISDSTFKSNSIGLRNGTAILSRSSLALSILDSTFEQNYADDSPDAYTVFVFDRSSTFLRESGLTFESNTPNNGIGPV